MTQLTQNADNVLIGKFLGTAALGLYGVGYSLIMLPASRIAAPLVQVFYPVFSRVQHDRRRLCAQWLRGLRMMAAVMVPAMLGLIVVAPDMVRVMLGPHWHGATPIIQILSVVGLAYGLQGLNGVVLLALGRSRVLFRYSCVLFVAAMVAFVVGLQWGIVGVAACFAAVNVFVQPAYMYVTARSMDIGLRECARALAGVAEAAAVCIAAAVLTRVLLVADAVPTTPRLVATIAVGALAYVPVLIWRAPEVVSELRLLRRRRTSDAAAGAEAVALANQVSPGVGG